ncbi:MAG TPA: hypothetical protein VGP72_13425 [Planctomycetota bacterium]|jgi:hypothetical protein
MQFKVIFAAATLVALALSVAVPAEEKTPPTPAKDPTPSATLPGATPIPPKPVIVATPQVTDWTAALQDLQSSDPAKQQAAAKTFLDSGARGYSALNALLKNADPKVAERAKTLRQQIDQRSMELYRDVETEHQKLQKEPVTVQALEKLRQNWSQMASYASQNALRQYGYQRVQEIMKQIEEVKKAEQILNELDQALKANPEPAGLLRAAVQVGAGHAAKEGEEPGGQGRAGALLTLQRFKDAIAAAEDGVNASGKDGRLTAPALKLLAEIYMKLDDAKNLEVVSKRIIQEYPRSLEIKFAHRSLLDVFIATKRWPDATAQVKAYAAAFPLDKEAQDSASELLETLMTDAQEYKQVAALADWMIETIPVERMRAEVYKLAGGCNEYVLKDYAKAKSQYSTLRDKFPDLVNPADINSALARLQAKIDGKFPKEPQEADAGPAGVLAKFLKAIRTRDAKAIATLVPKGDVEAYTEMLQEGGEERVPALTFADFVLKKVDVAADSKSAKLILEYYEAGGEKPKTITEPAVSEDGQWKINWADPEDVMEEEISTKIPLGGAKQ